MKPSKDPYRKDNTPSKKEKTADNSRNKYPYKSPYTSDEEDTSRTGHKIPKKSKGYPGKGYPDSKPPVSKPKPNKNQGDDNPGGSRVPLKPKGPKKGPGNEKKYNINPTERDKYAYRK
jgi:hypothetical protein